MLLQALDTLLLYELQEFILVLSSLLLGQFASQTFQLYGTRIAQCVDRMTDTIDKTSLVVSLLVEHTGEINIQFLHVLPVSDLLFQVMEHIDHLDVGTTMKRTFQAADTGGNRAVSICAGGRSDTNGKGRVVTTTMLCLDDEQQVEHSCIKLRIVFVLHHIEKVLCDGEVLARMTDMQTATLYRVAVDVVGIGDNGWELGYQLYALTHQVVAADVIRIWIECVHLEHASRQYVHDVAALQFDNMRDGAVVERHVVVEQFLKSFQLLLVRQLT